MAIRIEKLNKQDFPVIDELDKKLINALQEDCRTPLGVLAKKLGTSKSTVHYRIRRLENDGIIEGYQARISAAKLKKEYAAVVLARARPGTRLERRLKTGRGIASIPGIWSVYTIFGEYDFVFLVRGDDREDLAQKVNQAAILSDIERTNTHIVEAIIKEDARVELDSPRRSRR